MAPETMSMIEEVVHTGSIGDGKVLILDVEDVVASILLVENLRIQKN